MNYRDLLTITEFRDRDKTGKYEDYGDDTVGEMITLATYNFIEKVGHDFGDMTGAESMDGVRSRNLHMTGVTELPLRSLTEVQIDTYEVDTDDLILYPNHHMGGLFYKIRLKVGLWTGHTVTITGIWGWDEVPADVKEAVFRLAVKELTGSGYGASRRNVLEELGGDAIRSVTQPDGVKIEFQQKSITASLVGDADVDSLGDEFADNVCRRYQWGRSVDVV